MVRIFFDRIRDRIRLEGLDLSVSEFGYSTPVIIGARKKWISEISSDQYKTLS